MSPDSPGITFDDDREVVNNHIVATIKMLESLLFPGSLQNVPDYAGSHHEKMDGTGYPRGLKREEMSIQALIIAIADIFEALTASVCPYKKGNKLSECLEVMGRLQGHRGRRCQLHLLARKIRYLFRSAEMKPPNYGDQYRSKSRTSSVYRESWLSCAGISGEY